jgi:hypothetical protein
MVWFAVGENFASQLLSGVVENYGLVHVLSSRGFEGARDVKPTSDNDPVPYQVKRFV